MLGWGTADYLAALSSRKISAFQAYSWMVFVAAAISAAGVLLFDVSLSFSIITLVKIFGFAALLTIGNFSYFHGLSIGSVSLLAPLSSVWPIITVLFAILVYRESPTTLQFLGGVAILAGVILASLNWQELLKNFRMTTSDPGAKWVFIAVATWGLGYSFYSPLTRAYGWFEVSSLAWFSAAAMILAGSIVARRHIAVPKEWLTRNQLIAMGALFVFAQLSYSWGVQKDLTSVVTPVSALYAVVTMILALLFLRERLSRTQSIGIVVALAGLLLLSVQ